MKVLQLGGNGNLGSRVIPALLAHGHTVIAYIRTPDKLRRILPRDIIERITIVEGDAFDTDAVANALRKFACDALVNTAGTRQPLGQDQNLGRLVASVANAAVQVSKERGQLIRAWIIGGMGSLNYPRTGYKIQDYMPGFLTDHHRGTEAVMKKISTSDLEWSLLCVAMMSSESDSVETLTNPRKHDLLVQSWTPPGWHDHWIKRVPFLGVYLNLFPVVASYTTKLEDVADLIAEDLDKEKSEYIGQFVGFKAPKEMESS